MLVFLLFFVAYINIVVGNGTLSPADHAAIKTPKDQIGELNNTKVVLGEGGIIIPDNMSENSLKDNQTNLIRLDKELGNLMKVKPVKARKGAVLDDLQNSQSSMEEKIFSEAPNDVQDNKTSSTINPTPLPSKSNVTIELKGILSNSSKPIDELHLQNKTSVPKKPLILSYETLSMMNQSFSSSLKSSTKTIVADQVQSPNDDSVRVYSINANRHPGMVMPVVITILVVPMFAVLGYMALKKGKEAWKNRHYKRMDFLLDGMYND